MSQFWSYFNSGLQHVLDWNSYEHLLFISVLVAAQTFLEWKKIVWLIGLFTFGHTISLVLSTYEVVIVDNALVEFLVPLSILLTAIYNLATAGSKPRSNKVQGLYFATLFFGIVHGLGFSNYFQTISGNISSKALPLLEFELGIIAAQIIVVLAVLILSFIFQSIFSFSRRDWVLVISSVAIGLVIPMLLGTFFW